MSVLPLKSSDLVATSKVRVTVFAVESLVMVLIPIVPAPGPFISLFCEVIKGLFALVVAAQQMLKSAVDGKVITIVPLASICLAIGNSKL